jgi:hypothetical protein
MRQIVAGTISVPDSNARPQVFGAAADNADMAQPFEYRCGSPARSTDEAADERSSAPAAAAAPSPFRVHRGAPWRTWQSRPAGRVRG